MRTWRVVHIGSISILTADVALLFGVNDAVAAKSGMIALALLLIGLHVWAGRSIQRLRERESTERTQETVIRALSYHRHDWMNDIQVLSGYAKLKKYEQLSRYVEKIREKTMRESQLSKIHIPSLQMFLLTFRANYNKMNVIVDLQEQLNVTELGVDPALLSALVQDVVLAFHDCADMPESEPNELEVKIGTAQTGPVVDFDYRGTLTGQMRSTLDRLARSYGRACIFRYEREGDEPREDAWVSVQLMTGTE